MTEIEKYQAKLDSIVASNSSAIFANYTQEHAECIFRTFIRNAQREVLLLVGDFTGGIYIKPDIRSAILCAIDRGVNLRVISLTPERRQEMEQYRNIISPNAKGHYDYRIGRVKSGVLVHHYMVVDGKAYRYEEPHIELHPTEVHAEVCWNGVEGASLLSRRFVDIWSRLS